MCMNMGILSSLLGGGLNIGGSGGSAGTAYSGGGIDDTAGDVVFGSLDTSGTVSSGTDMTQLIGVGMVAAALVAGYILGR